MTSLNTLDPLLFNSQQVTLLFKALTFAAQRHRTQRRKDDISPYINHPIQVAQILWEVGKVRDMITLVGGLLHDVLEDTPTTPEEIEELFGTEVLSLVQEVSDDKNLPKMQRKLLQVEHAPHVSSRAKQVKLADKICNVYDLTHFPPRYWSWERRWEYLEWSEQVIAGLRGSNDHLETHYDQLLRDAKHQLYDELLSNTEQPHLNKKRS